MKFCRLGLIPLLFSSCSYMGPSTISATRPGYNLAIQQTNDQELLLNLVRIRYRDTLYFTTIERIAASQEFNRAIGAAATGTSTSNSFAGVATGSSIARILSGNMTLGPSSISVNEKPTVFYTPLEGEKFVRQLMTPMNPETLLLLIKSGWSLNRVFSVGIQEMNGLKNAPTAAGPSPLYAPVYKDFKEASRYFRALQAEQLVDVVASEDAKGIEFHFAESANQRPEMRELRKLLSLSPDSLNFALATGGAFRNSDTISLSTRPLMAALSYISQGVEVVEEDTKSGKVRVTINKDGTPFIWQNLLKDIFQVKSSITAPKHASVCVQYKGRYFYIPEDDLETKSTFVLITQLFALHSVTPSSAQMGFSFGK